MKSKNKTIISIFALALVFPLFSYASFFDFLKLPKVNLAVVGSIIAPQPTTYMVISLKHSQSTNKFTAENLVFTSQPQFGDLEYTNQYELRELDATGAVLYKRTFPISHEEHFESFGPDGPSSSFNTVDIATVDVPILFSPSARKLVIFNQKTNTLEDFDYDIFALVESYNQFVTVVASAGPAGCSWDLRTRSRCMVRRK